jgi:RNA polymerase sigma-70 factor (ECF subfamily)
MDAYESSGRPPDTTLSSDISRNQPFEGGLVNDREIFIKNTFSKDPALGCELLFKRYYGMLCSHAVRYVYSKSIAEDIVSEVFTSFWEKRSFENIQSSYRAYLFSMVRNRSLNFIKREFGKGQSTVLDSEMDFAANEDPALILQADELNKLIEKTIQSLPAKCQLVFLMSRLEGKKNIVISGELNISVKAIEAQITKALDRLRKTLQQDYLSILILYFITAGMI